MGAQSTPMHWAYECEKGWLQENDHYFIGMFRQVADVCSQLYNFHLLVANELTAELGV